MLEFADDIFWVRDWRRYGGNDVDSPVRTKSLTSIYFPGAFVHPDRTLRQRRPGGAHGRRARAKQA